MATYIFNRECPGGMKQAFIDTYGPKQSNDKLKLVVETTANYKKSGISSATRDDTSKPIVIDWGDGTIEQVNGNVSQKVHTYSTVGTFNVIIENIKSYAASTYDYTWYYTTSQNSYTLKEVISIPGSMISVGSDAFYGCSGLTSVTIPNGVTSIGDYAFQGCSGLTSVTIPDSVTSIGDHAFSECGGLTSLTIPDGVESIGSEAFFYCRGLTTMTIPDSVTSIGSSAFMDTIMESVTFENRTMSQVQAMQNYSWGIDRISGASIGKPPTVTIVCSDGQLVFTIQGGGGGSI